MSTDQLMVKQGATVTGEASGEYFGYSVSISATGDTIVVGAYGANKNTGYVKVYKNISGTWTLQGAKITGEATNECFGYSVSISATGDTIVVGAWGANSYTGYAKVYKNISGTWTLQGAKITGEATNEYFGTSVSISASGDTIVVGAHYAAVGDNSYTGYAKVYKNISGTWTQQGAKITGEATNECFGWSVSISASGDSIVVGTPYAAVGDNSFTGYVKVYKNISGTWTLQGAKITGETTNDRFGYSVSISATGDTIVVGAHTGNSNTGYAKVYKNISGTWTQQGATLTGEASNDRFGNSVSISASGDTIVIGASGANSQRGYVKVYKNISGTWTQQGATLTGEATNEYFGYSVSISATGDTIVVGAWGANSDTGYVKVYKNISGTWTLQGATVTGEASGEWFGDSVSISASGDTVVVGAYGANSSTGYVKVYKNISGTWTQQGAKITGEASNDRFGISVSISATGDTIVVGASGANSDTGYVKVYKNISGTWTLQGAKITGEATDDEFGISVSISATGDTIVVGASGANSYTGYVKVYKNISGTWTQQGATVTGEASGEWFGYSVSISASGDTIVVGAWVANSNTGYVKVYKNISGTWTLQGAKITGETTYDYFGVSVSISASGDTIVVGAWGANSYRGTAYIFDLQPEGVSKVPENQSTEGLLCTITTEVNYPVLKDRACKSPIDQPQLS